MVSLCFQYRLYPTLEQESTLLEHLEVCRHLYNGAIFERQDTWKYDRRSIGYVEQAKQLPLLKQKAPLLSTVYSQVLQNSLKRLDTAYQHFFRRLDDYKARKAQGALKKGEEPPRPPRFKSLDHYRSLCYPQWGNGVKIANGCLVLSKIGPVPLRLHRPLEGTPKTCTIAYKADGWYAAITCEVEIEPLPQTGQEVGIDVGIENFATFTDDHAAIPNPRPLEQALTHLKKAQKRLERRTRRDKNGRLLPQQSRRRQRAKGLLAKAHLRVARARADFHHKVAHRLVQQFDTLYVERLNITALLKNHYLARHIADVGWGRFLSVLKQKAERAGRTIVEVNPAYTSQNCSGCGEYVPKTLSERKHSCPYCGLTLHRDKNAAENIRKKGRDAAFSERSALAAS